MSYLSRLLIVSAVWWLCCSAQADAGTPASMFIGEVNLITSWKHEVVVNQSVVESFKELLRKHGYQTDECEENTAALQRMALRAASPDKPEVYKQIDERLIAAQKCKIPSSATHAYDVKLILTYDAELKSRRAIIHLVALGNYPPIDGGYAHKPGQLMGWYELMNRAIDRALGRYNDPTAVHVNAPTEATVGETVKLDARKSWDPDGDAFELRWRVNVQACTGAGEALPLDRRRCPAGLKRGPAPVPSQAGAQDLTREFRVPMVGDYEIGVYSKVGAREELVKTLRLRSYPRRSWTFFSRQSLLRVPKYFLSDSPKQELSLMMGAGLLRRFVHRIGLYGWFEEIHFGVSFASLGQLSTYTSGGASGILVGLELLARVLDRTGHYGVASSTTLSMVLVEDAGQWRRSKEWGWSVASLIGWYYAFGENYLDKTTRFCNTVCPSVTFGPTLTTMMNLTYNKTGIVLGAETLLGIEF